MGRATVQELEATPAIVIHTHPELCPNSRATDMLGHSPLEIRHCRSLFQGDRDLLVQTSPATDGVMLSGD